MHRLSVVILTILALSLGAAVAQQTATPPDPTDVEVEVDVFAPQVVITPPRTDWFGGSIGLNPFLSGYYGLARGLAPDIDLRFRAGLNILWGLGFTVGADALFHVAQFGAADEFDLYVGGGPNINFVTVADISLLGIGVQGLGGVEYRLNPDLGLFAEAGLGFQYGFVTGTWVGVAPLIGGFLPDFRTALGINFYF